jgi:hypothetical protein
MTIAASAVQFLVEHFRAWLRRSDRCGSGIAIELERQRGDAPQRLPAIEFFHIPLDRLIEIGGQVEI